jgi:Flagellar-associated PapD-like
VTGATAKGFEILAQMRGLSVQPDHVDFGVLKEGYTYGYTVMLKNTGIDTCRFRIQQPPLGTGIRVRYAPGPVSRSHDEKLIILSTFGDRLSDRVELLAITTVFKFLGLIRWRLIFVEITLVIVVISHFVTGLS